MNRVKMICVASFFVSLCLVVSACANTETIPASLPPAISSPIPTEATTPVVEPPTNQTEQVSTLPEYPGTLTGEGAVQVPPTAEDGIEVLGAPLPPAGMPDVPFPWPDHLPQHVPGSIRLHSDIEGWLGMPYPAQHRYIFYSIPGIILGLIDDQNALNEFLNALTEATHLYEMPLMLLVQHFNIPKEDFVEAIEESRARRIELGFDLYDELHELPNADIIFTFDNDIIRYFYRRA